VHSFATRLRGIVHRLNQNYPAALAAHREVLELRRSLSPESEDVVTALNDIALVEQFSGDFAAAKLDFREALRIAQAVGSDNGVANCTGKLAGLALEQAEWAEAETWAREAIALAEKLGRKELIAADCARLARALDKQGKATEGRPYAQRAVDFLDELGSPNVEEARAILKECES